MCITELRLWAVARTRKQLHDLRHVQVTCGAQMRRAGLVTSWSTCESFSAKGEARGWNAADTEGEPLPPQAVLVPATLLSGPCLRLREGKVASLLVDTGDSNDSEPFASQFAARVLLLALRCLEIDDTVRTRSHGNTDGEHACRLGGQLATNWRRIDDRCLAMTTVWIPCAP